MYVCDYKVHYQAESHQLQREADHRENLATTIRSLRANESQQTLEIVR